MDSWNSLQTAFAEQGYVASDELAMALHIARSLDRPILLEGATGVGKTEVARTLAAALGTELIRLQCYEGLDAASAVYEWNYPAQMIEIRLAEAGGAADRDTLASELFSERFRSSASVQKSTPMRNHRCRRDL